jgi:hypothetical protein
MRVDHEAPLHSGVTKTERFVLILGLLFLTSCVHRVQPHFSERKCVRGTEMWDVAYQGQMTQVCVVVDPVTKQPVLTVPVVMPSVDPNDTDGDEGAAADKPHKHWWHFRQRRDSNDKHDD